jgi:hypothetical protein
VQPDPWPGSALMPDTLHPYLYAGANPIVYRDPSGRCYGPLQFLRHAEGVSCANLDMANTILQSPHASLTQKAQAGMYKGFFWGSHIGLVAGTVGLGAAAVPELAAVGGGEILSAAATGARVGSIIGGGYGGLRYLLARSGACGCEAQQWALSTSREKFSRQVVIQAIGGAGLFSGVGGIEPWGQIATGLAGLGLSGRAGYKSIQDMISQQRVNPCNAVNLGLSVVGVGFSSYQLRSGIQGVQPRQGEQLASTEFRIVATDDRLADTLIPKSFRFMVGDSEFWVHPNATKHMAELLVRGPAGRTTFGSQLLLESLAEAVSIVTSEGIVFDELVVAGNWRLVFGPPRGADLLPVIYHALYIP